MRIPCSILVRILCMILVRILRVRSNLGSSSSSSSSRRRSGSHRCISQQYLFTTLGAVEPPCTDAAVALGHHRFLARHAVHLDLEEASAVRRHPTAGETGERPERDRRDRRETGETGEEEKEEEGFQ